MEDEYPMAPVFAPTMEEFKDFAKYVESIQPKCTNGICKIIPPPEWGQPFDYSEYIGENAENDIVIPCPIKQVVSGNKGIYQLYLIEQSKQSLSKFAANAEKNKRAKSSKYQENDTVDRTFWKNVKFDSPTYGADMSGSLFKSFKNPPEVWNPNSLPSVLNVLGATQNLPGITTPYLYFGMWKAMFAWHVEDMNLFSINYLHFGEAKSWYSVSPEDGPRLEKVAQGFFPEQYRECHEFLRHKTSLISPSVLAANKIPLTKVVQEAGEFVITFPYSYHCGFNHGFNCAEAVNFATESWIEWGKKAKFCTCQSDTAQIDMDSFVSVYDQWKSNPVDLSNCQVPVVEITKKRKGEGSPEKTSPTKKNKETHIGGQEGDGAFLHSQQDTMDIMVDEVNILTNEILDSMIQEQQGTIPSLSNTSHTQVLHPDTGNNLMNMNGMVPLLIEQQPQQKKEKRGYSKRSPAQRNILEKRFEELRAIPSLSQRVDLAREVNWTPQGIYHWFRRKAVENGLSTTPLPEPDGVIEEEEEERGTTPNRKNCRHTTIIKLWPSPGNTQAKVEP